MSTFLFYNGQQIMSGQATPFVARDDLFVRYGERWADKTTFSLHGQITGGCSGYGNLINNQNKLINIFSKDFQTFQISENGSGIFSSNAVMVKSIDFPSNPYSYILNYVVTLDCYPTNFFSGVYGILEPSDDWSYEEQNDYNVNLTHAVSARGFNTSSTAANGLQNAKNFVLARTGLANAVSHNFVNGPSGLNFCLKDLNERIDRFNGTYSVTEKYVADSYYGTDGSLRYTTTFDCDTIQGVAKVGVQGEIAGCGKATSMNAIRDRYNALSLYNLASDAFSSAGAGGSLNAGFLSKGVVEDPFNKKINFNISYDNNPFPTTYLDYSITIEVSENEITTVSFKGVIKGRGDINTRWTAVQAFYSTLNAYSYALNAYNAFSPSSPYPLNILPINESVSFNKFNAEISVSISWNNKDIPLGGFKNFNYTMNFIPSIQKVAFTPLANLCNLQYYVADLGYKSRCKFSIHGDGKICSPHSIAEGILFVRQLGNSKFGDYCPFTKAILERKQIDTTTEDVKFDFGWSAVSSTPVNSPGSYERISNLRLK